MAISLIAYAKADIRAAHSALGSIRAKEGNEKATKGIAAYHDGIKVPKGIKEKAYMYSNWEAAGRYDLHFSVRTDSVERRSAWQKAG